LPSSRTKLKLPQIDLDEDEPARTSFGKRWIV
jgi:hypothetical protein